MRTLLLLALLSCGAASGSEPALREAQLTPDQRARLGTLRALARRAPELGLESPVYDPRSGKDLTAAEVGRLLGTPRESVLVPPAPPNERRRAEPASLGELRKGFEGFGPLPAGEYAGGLRGPALPADGAAVAPRGRTLVEARFAADNFLTESRTDGSYVLQKFENHSVTVDVRRGMGAVELGARVRTHQRGEGFLNGFIAGFERGAARAFDSEYAINPNRSGPSPLRGTHDVVSAGGSFSFTDGTHGIRLGDAMATAKAALGRPAGTALAARAAVNLATGGPFTSGWWAGAGLSATRPLARRLAAHADARVTLPLTERAPAPNDPLAKAAKAIGFAPPPGLPLRRAAFGGTAGVEVALGDKTSFGVQVNAQGTPYRRTGSPAHDDMYADVTVGFSRLATVMSRKVLIKVWGKEDFNPAAPDRDYLGPHGDSDFSLGVSFSPGRL